jgi:hypothetical protein
MTEFVAVNLAALGAIRALSRIYSFSSCSAWVRSVVALHGNAYLHYPVLTHGET